MALYMRAVMVAISLLSVCCGVLVVGPKFVRSNQEYTVVISNFNKASSKVNLMLRLEAYGEQGTPLFSIPKQVDVRRFMNRIVSVKLKMNGLRGLSFSEEEDLVFLSKSLSGLIQIDKPVFKPGDKVRFRVIVLDTELKPPASLQAIQVTVRDHQNIVVRKWSSAKLYAGVFEGDLQIASMQSSGAWNITAQVDGQELAWKTFEVKEYVLSSFDVEVLPSTIPLEEHQGLTLTVAANYHFGRPVKGLVKMELYLEDEILDQRKEFEVNGMGQVELRFRNELKLFQDQQDVQVKVIFTEQYTNRVVTKEQAITVYKYLYRASLAQESSQFRPGFPFHCVLTLRYHDGTPARYIPVLVQVEGDSVEHEQEYTTDRVGTIKLVMHPQNSTEAIDVTLTEESSGFSFTERIDRVEQMMNAFMKLELKSTVKLNRLMRLMVTCSERMTFFVYYVVAKGNILDAGFMRPNRQTKYQFQINASEKMVPKAHIFVATVFSNVVIWDALEIDLKQLSNHLEINIDESVIKPGQELEIQLRGRPSAYVGLAAYDKGLLEFSGRHDLFWEDVMQVFDDFHAVGESEFNAFHGKGLFIKTSRETMLEPANTPSRRFGRGNIRPYSKLVAYRTNFLESWLWQNVTIDPSGKKKMIEIVPDTTTSWYLTGFSIDPVYGLGIIKKPIQFTTVQPFYIVENLPYSIKRGEAAVLQFTLFNNLGGEYIADVTLYNVANQTEFVGRPLEDLSYTKSVSVPPKVGVPVSFLVKARKLGEMAVRVKASIMLGLETDALEKVIRVMPENIIIHNTDWRFFNLYRYQTQEFNISLDVLKDANMSTVKLEFILSSNLLTPVTYNLENLLTVPTASGAPSMINFIPNLVVLDYLMAIGSNEKHLINKAKGLLRNGYQLEMQYRQPDGSFGNWPKSQGSIFVTALVGKSMQSASSYISEVDLSMVSRLYEWLASKQHSSGRFEEIAPITYQALQGGSRNHIALTSYVLIAFLENSEASKKHQQVVRKGIQYIANYLPHIEDVYDLSLATYALLLDGHTQKLTALNALIKRAHSFQGADGKELYWARDTAEIETTAYGLLCLVHEKRYVDGISVMQWLVKRREVSGSFPRTQDTFVGLKALAMLAQAISPLNNDYSVMVRYGRTRKVYKVTSTDVDQQSRDVLTGTGRMVTVSVDGRGFGLFTIAYQYGIDVRNIDRQFRLSVRKRFSNQGFTLQLRVCTSFMPQLAYTRSNLALVEVNFPSGYVIDKDSLVDITNRSPFQNVEFRYGQTSLVLYYESLGPENNCFTVTAEKWFRVAFLRPAYVLVHDFYIPNFTLVISNFNAHQAKVDLMLQISGQTDDGANVLNITQMVDVRRNMNRMINFNMPADLSAGNYRITIDGQRGFSFHKEAELVYLSKIVSGLIQIDKPVFKPGDTVQFRVIVLDTELKPPARLKAIHVTIRDPLKNVVRKWSSAKLYAGVFEGDLQIAPTPMLGIWNISVLVDGEELVSKTFEVKEYVLSSFDVEVLPSTIPLEEHQGLNLTVAANYHFGKPVKGLVKMELYLEDDKLDQRKEFEVYGMGQVALRFAGYFGVHEDQQDVLVKTTFIEQYTNRTVVKQSQITVYKYTYRVELIKDSPQFRPGLPFKCALQFRNHDGTPARGVTGKVEVIDVEYEETATSDKDGLIKFELNPGEDIEGMDINFSNDETGFYFYERVDKVDIVTNTYIKLELKSPIKLNRLLRLMVTCNERMTFFVYYVVSKGNIIDSGFMRPNRQNKYPLQLNATEKMIPKAKIIVATVASRTVVYDFVDIDFEELRNNFDLSIDEQEVKPGRQIELRMSGRPGAYVGLAAYDKGLLYYNKNHDLFWEDIMQVFDGFHAIDENEFDKIHSMGLFARTLDDIMFDGANDKSARDGLQINHPTTKLVAYRTNFLESWLWQNVTIGRSGTKKMIEIVPDTTTSWYLTGFSIDPVYGLGIIKKPIQFTTVQPFYIVENLPYSIKRGEAAVLQFTLFNNLGGEYIADVTLYNVANQTEFVGRPLEDLSYTKSVSVPPKVGVPVSFLVKARKLGEMAVRVKASIMLGLETDALEKVIRVMPESLEHNKMESRFFCYDNYKNSTFLMNLDIDKKADNGSRKIAFQLNPNLLTTVIKNLDNLLAVPSGCGEQNMVKFVPNIVVLDYLNAIGSKDQTLINKATDLLRTGYQNQMRYRQSDGSFGVWHNGGSVFLTAFVAKSMQTASKYISEVDAAMVERAYDWLAAKQHSSGRFDEVGSVIHKDMQGGLGNGVALTSYVLTALLENENAKVKHAVVIQNAMAYLSSRIESINRAYDLSIATYALMLNGHDKKTLALNRLVDMSIVSDTERYWSTDNSIETTAYALLSFVIAQKYLDGIPVMRWLVNQRYVTGSFPRTQDTFVGLKALTKLAEKISPSRNDYTITLKYKRSVRNFYINSQDINITSYEDIPEDTRALEVNVGGIGFGLLQVIYQYSLNLVNFAHRFKLDLERQSTGSEYELRMRVCANFIPKMTDSRSNMALVEVNFPSGYVVDRSPISEQTTINPIQNIEIRYGGTSVVVYYNNMGIERNCFTVTAFRRFKVALKRPAHVVVYDYYNPKFNAIEVYEVDKQNVCEICEEGDCPKECAKA
uniref:TEP1-F n=1 Tax=Anopheles stephensi TaxID=30069 RepID=A0A182YIZ6_ANOST